MKTYIATVLLSISLGFAGCGWFGREDAKQAFLKENPTFTVVNLHSGEGWDGVVNYHFEYKKPGDHQLYREAWTFVRQDDGMWKATGKWKE